MKRSHFIAAAGLVVLGLLASWLAQPSGLSVTFFDIGQGDAELVRTAKGQTILIDGGPDRTILTKLGQTLPWTKRSLDLVILSHPHADHVTGLTYVLQRYHVRHVLLTGALHTTPEYLEFLKLIKQQRIPVTVARTGQTFNFAGNVTMEVLWPKDSYAGVRVDDLNRTSIVNRLRWGNTAALFTGDTPAENELALLALGAELKAQLLKVAHQGSRTSSSEEFLRAVAPQAAIIPVGANNRYGHPHPEVVRRLQRLIPVVLRTDQDGDITFISDGEVWQRR